MVEVYRKYHNIIVWNYDYWNSEKSLRSNFKVFMYLCKFLSYLIFIYGHNSTLTRWSSELRFIRVLYFLLLMFSPTSIGGSFLAHETVQLASEGWGWGGVQNCVMLLYFLKWKPWLVKLMACIGFWYRIALCNDFHACMVTTQLAVPAPLNIGRIPVTPPPPISNLCLVT